MSKFESGFFLKLSFYGPKNGPREESSCSSRVNMTGRSVPLRGILYSSADAGVYSGLCTKASLSS